MRNWLDTGETDRIWEKLMGNSWHWRDTGELDRIQVNLTGYRRTWRDTGELDGIWENLTGYGWTWQDTGQLDGIQVNLTGYRRTWRNKGELRQVLPYPVNLFCSSHQVLGDCNDAWVNVCMSQNFACFLTSNTSFHNLGVMWKKNQKIKSAGNFFWLSLPNGEAFASQ